MCKCLTLVHVKVMLANEWRVMDISEYTGYINSHVRKDTHL